MADVRIQIEGDSEPAVALALLETILRAEEGAEEIGRDWILATYAECLAVVRGEMEVTLEEEEAGVDEAPASGGPR